MHISDTLLKCREILAFRAVGRMEARALTDSELLEALTELHARIDQLHARVHHLLDLHQQAVR